VGADWFAVYLIPETLRVTSLGAKREGATVNLEIEAQTQAIVDTVEVNVLGIRRVRRLLYYMCIGRMRCVGGLVTRLLA